jgi:hypothetical protein
VGGMFSTENEHVNRAVCAVSGQRMFDAGARRTAPEGGRDPRKSPVDRRMGGVVRSVQFALARFSSLGGKAAELFLGVGVVKIRLLMSATRGNAGPVWRVWSGLGGRFGGAKLGQVRFCSV